MTKNKSRKRQSHGKGKLRNQPQNEEKQQEQENLENDLNQMVAPIEVLDPEKILKPDQVEKLKTAARIQGAKTVTVMEEEPKQDSPTTSTPPSTPKSTSTPSRDLPFRPNPQSPGQQTPRINPAFVSAQGSPSATNFYKENKDRIIQHGKDKFDAFIEGHEIVHREDPYFKRLQEFIDTEWGLPAVVVQFRGLFSGGYPPIPVPTQWGIPSNLDITELVWQQVQTESFQEEMFPSVKMMLGDNINNSIWAAQVLTVLAFFRIIQILPLIVKDE